MAETTALIQPRSRLRAVTPHALLSGLLFFLAWDSHGRVEYVAIAGFWGVLTGVGPRARRFLSIATPVLLVGLLYDKLLPLLSPYRRPIHVADLYLLEKRLFGIAANGRVENPSEWLARHTSAPLDVACGLAYLTFIVESFAAACWLFFVDQARAARFTWAFFACNVIGIACELLVPAAPPWYVADHGLGPAKLDVVASAAGTARFDAFFGIHYFAAFYARSRDVFGAMPSLHVAYPVVVLLAVWRARPRGVRVAAAGYAGLMAFSAVYLDHHYVLDVIAGVVAAVLAYLVTVAAERVLGGKQLHKGGERRPPGSGAS